jgi:hypothetical protein
MRGSFIGVVGWIVISFASLLNVVSIAQADVVWDESTDGDLSSIYSFPTFIPLAPGVNSIRATSGFSNGLDWEYFTLELPAGTLLTQLNMADYQNTDTTFLGLQSGEVFTFPPDEAFSKVGELLGWVHFGGNYSPGDDMLPDMGTADGAIGFVPPLGGQFFSFWIQQFNEDTTYQLDFIVTPEPTALGLLAIGATLALSRRSCRRLDRRR